MVFLLCDLSLFCGFCRMICGRACVFVEFWGRIFGGICGLCGMTCGLLCLFVVWFAVAFVDFSQYDFVCLWIFCGMICRFFAIKSKGSGRRKGRAH